MKRFSHVIQDELGIHARPAGILVKQVVKFSSDIEISKGERTANARRLFAVMSLGAKRGDTIDFTIDGEDEEEALAELQTFCKANL